MMVNIINYYFLIILFFYSIGSNIWISAPGYKLKTLGYYKSEYKSFQATSSATPVVSGVVALMREANPNLTWRDVKLILAESAVKNDPNHKSWKVGRPKKSEPTKSFHFSHHYGFGMVNAKKAVDLSKRWHQENLYLPLMQKIESSVSNPNISIDANSKNDVITISDNSIQFIESVVVELDFSKRINIKDTDEFDLQLKHDETLSHLHMKGKSFTFKNSSGDKYYSKDRMPLTMLTNAHLGESAAGKWTLEVRDTKGFTRLNSWKLIIRGH